LDVGTGLVPHQGRAKHHRKIAAVHPVNAGVLLDTIEMQCKCPQCGIVGIREAVDDGMKRVPSDNVIIVL
jgi:hypothetical protein